MKPKMRIMTERPLNAETPAEKLRSWITPNEFFFDRNQGAIPARRTALDKWRLQVVGLVAAPITLTFDDILDMPRAIAANTLECSGNGRSLLLEKAQGNPWTIGGVGNAVWGGVWLRDVLARAGLDKEARHVCFEGIDRPTGSAGIKFVRSIPMEKALDSTLLAYEMNGAPLPLNHGYPLRALALGWTGANCVKWLTRITALDRPFEGFFMDHVYRVFQKGQEPSSGDVVTGIKLKAIITRPLHGESVPVGEVVILGAAYGGEHDVHLVEISVDNGIFWEPVQFIGPHERYAWRQWQYVWKAPIPGKVTIMARATDEKGRTQPMHAAWNALGYGNNGVFEHAVEVTVQNIDETSPCCES